MSAKSKYQPQTKLGAAVHSFEETAIAVLLGLMTLVTFANVVARYVFNATLIWGLETTLILFAWLIIFGISYGVKTTSHLGVDALINVLPPGPRRVLALVSAAACLIYALLLLKGAYDYWAPFAALPRTEGRVIPTGLDFDTRDRAFYVTDQVPMLGIFRWLEGAINMGEEYEKLPRVVPYTILPVGAALLLYRFIEATLQVWRGERDSLIVSHEAEEAMDDATARAARE